MNKMLLSKTQHWKIHPHLMGQWRTLRMWSERTTRLRVRFI